jgi:hypothetical protein
MRSHGVRSFPDPDGRGDQFSDSSGINPETPAFQSARRACSKLLPAGPVKGPASQSRRLMMLKLSECMRNHGVPSFPDPTSTAPAPGTGFALAFGAPGSFVAVPGSLLSSPAYEQAARTCGLPGAGRPGAAKTDFAAG